MATSTLTKPDAAKTTTAVKPVVSLGKRLDAQVTRAVLAGKMTHDDLRYLADRLSKLHGFVSQE